jgi:hypothetical protein
MPRHGTKVVCRVLMQGQGGSMCPKEQWMLAFQIIGGIFVILFLAVAMTVSKARTAANNSAL